MPHLIELVLVNVFAALRRDIDENPAALGLRVHVPGAVGPIEGPRPVVELPSAFVFKLHVDRWPK